MHLAWDYLHMVADNGNVALLELRERIYNTGSAEIPQDAAPPVLPYQQESVVPQAPPAGQLITLTTPCPRPPPAQLTTPAPPHPTVCLVLSAGGHCLSGAACRYVEQTLGRCLHAEQTLGRFAR